MARKPPVRKTVSKQLRMPDDWWQRIDEMRGATPLSVFVRSLLRPQIDTDKTRPLSDPKPWGGPRQ